MPVIQALEMGQGYKALILGSQPDQGAELIRTWVNPHDYNNGYKLTEHSYIGNNFVGALEFLISPLGMFYKSRVVWCGDYADKEAGLDQNLYEISDNEINGGKVSRPVTRDMSEYRYIVNHTTGEYVDKATCVSQVSHNFHPLPLLTAEGNGRGGGDYHGTNEEMVGKWARHVLSVEKEKPAGYTELVCDFRDE